MKITLLKYCFVFGAVLMTGIALINTGQRVQMMERQISANDRKIEAEKEAIRTLKAEWAYLNTPARLENLAVNAFGLHAPLINTLDTKAHIIPDETTESIIFKLPRQKPHFQNAALGHESGKHVHNATVTVGGAP